MVDGLYRIIAPASIAGANHPDWQVEIYRPGAVKMSMNPSGSLRAIQGLREPESIDVLLVQRTSNTGSLQFLQWMQGHGCAVVVDADDALWAIDRDNKAWKAWQQPDHHWSYMDRAAEIADLVTVTTPALARRYGKHGRVEVIPNRVPAAATTLLSVRDQFPPALTIGWAGFTSTHPHDLPVVGDAVRRVLTEHPEVVVRIVGDGKGVAKAWGLDPAQVFATGAVPIDRYLSALSCIDIALVPLADTPFNRAKSALKAAEFSAAGVPVIASPTPAHKAHQQDGYPLLIADTPADWYRHLSRLVENPQVARERGEAARTQARRHTMEDHAREWVAAWQRAAQRRTRLVSA